MMITAGDRLGYWNLKDLDVRSPLYHPRLEGHVAHVVGCIYLYSAQLPNISVYVSQHGHGICYNMSNERESDVGFAETTMSPSGW